MEQPPTDIETIAPRPFLVLVTGEPGSGKTSLGLELSRVLRLPFVSRDDVRGGLLATAGLWTNQIRTPTDRETARETFVRIAEAMAGLGVSAIIEFIAFRDDPTATQRLIAAADCVAIWTTCDDASARADRRDRMDPLLQRDSVLAALGHGSIEDYLCDQERKAVLARMESTLDLPLLRVRTGDGYDPSLSDIADWVVDRRRRWTST